MGWVIPSRTLLCPPSRVLEPAVPCGSPATEAASSPSTVFFTSARTLPIGCPQVLSPPKTSPLVGHFIQVHVLQGPWWHLPEAMRFTARTQQPLVSDSPAPPAAGRKSHVALTGPAGCHSPDSRQKQMAAGGCSEKLGLRTPGAETPGPALSPFVWPGTKSRACGGGSCPVTLGGHT